MIKAVNNFVELNRQLQVIKYFLSSTSNSVFLFFSGGQFISFLKLTKELKIILCNPKSNQLEETIIIFDYFKKQFNIRLHRLDINLVLTEIFIRFENRKVLEFDKQNWFCILRGILTSTYCYDLDVKLVICVFQNIKICTM